MAATLEITGNVRNRFIQAAALLRLLDPVRGEPIAYGLDQDLHNVQSPRERLLKRKFLDSFALICATRKDGDTVSAACLEEGGPEGTVVRIASNAGVSEGTLSHLRDILALLNSIAIGVPHSSNRETEVLLEIIRLDITKIQQYVQDIRRAESFYKETIPALESRLVEVLPQPTLPPIQHFLDWFGHIFSIQDLPTKPEPDVLLGYIRWAQKAKNLYFDLLKAAFANGNQSLPRWVSIVFKLGRYGIAAKALVQIASEIPALFNPMVVEPVPAPRKVRFTIGDEEMALTCVLRRVAEIKPEETIPRLARIWNTEDAEAFFRRSCSVDLVTHAELQMINFYDHNPYQMPHLRFIGVSKNVRGLYIGKYLYRGSELN